MISATWGSCRRFRLRPNEASGPIARRVAQSPPNAPRADAALGNLGRDRRQKQWPRLYDSLYDPCRCSTGVWPRVLEILRNDVITQDDVRRIALSLPGAEEGEPPRFSVRVMAKDKPRGFVWDWLERIHPKQARVPNPRVIAARTNSVAERDMMIASDPRVFFTEPHYNGYPAVLVRLDAVSMAQLEIVVTEAWRSMAPKELSELVD